MLFLKKHVQGDNMVIQRHFCNAPFCPTNSNLWTISPVFEKKQTFFQLTFITKTTLKMQFLFCGWSTKKVTLYCY